MAKRPRLEFNRVTQVQKSNNYSHPPIGTIQSMTILPVSVTIPKEEQERPKAVFWDEQGRLHDEKGNIINLKVNIICFPNSIVVIE